MTDSVSSCYSILLAVSLLAAVAVVHLSEPVDADPAAPILSLSPEQSFSLSTILQILTQDGKSASYQLDEAYSAWRGRSRVKYRATSGTDERGLISAWQLPGLNERLSGEGTIYTITRSVDLSALVEPQVFLVDETKGRKSCSLLNVETVTQLFATSSVACCETPQQQKHIVGGARLLFWVEQNRDKMKQRPDPNDLMVSNQRAIAFDLELPKLTAVIYYSKLLMQDQPVTTHVLSPLEVLVALRGGPELRYSFSQVQVHARADESFVSRAFSGLDNLETSQSEDDILYDQFSLPHLAACSRDALKKQKQAPSPLNMFPFSTVGGMNKDFRFTLSGRMRVPKVAKQIGLFVAYESQLGSLRADRFDAAKHSSVLVNYPLDRMYHILRARSSAKSDKLIGGIFPAPNQANTGREKGQANSWSCIVNKASVVRQARGKTPYRLDELLLGAERFLFIGRAKVRGLVANVFEAYDAEWPLFLRQWIVYRLNETDISPIANEENKKVQWKFCKPRPQVDGSNPYVQRPILVTTVYVGLDGQRLLMLEVRRLGPLLLNLIDTTQVAVHDFSWELEVPAPDGERAEQLFSLADTCSASSSAPSEQQLNGNRNHYAQVEMLLAGSVSGSQLQWLAHPTRRHLALLQAMQNYMSLPATMVDNLQSHLHNSKTSNSNASELLLPVSFRLMEHTQSFSELVSLGGGVIRPNIDWRDTRYLRFETPFQSCYFLAAHLRQAEIHFYYDQQQELCLIDKRPANQDPDYQSPFLWSLSGTGELYAVRHRHQLEQLPDYLLGGADAVSSLTRGSDRLKYLRALVKLPLIYSRTVNNVGRALSLVYSQADFFVRSLEATEDDASTGAGYQLDERHQADARRFVGLELVAPGGESSSSARSQSALSWRLVAVESELWSNSGMRSRAQSADDQQSAPNFRAQLTLEQCQSACLASSECRWFSFCARGARLECVLTRAELAQPEVVVLLLNATKNLETGRGSFDLELDMGEQTVRLQLNRHPSCELRQKNYLSLFAAPIKSKQTLAGRPVMPVSDRHECAQLCFEHTQSALRNDVQQAAKHSWGLVADSSSQADTIRLAIKTHRSALASVCKAFYYLDALELLALDKVSHSELLSHIRAVGMTEKEQQQPKHTRANGYCMLGVRVATLDAEHKQHQDKAAAGEASRLVYIRFERHAFDFLHLFERRYGVSLRQSAKSDDELDAFARISHSNGELATRQSYELMRQFSERGDNMQQRLYGDYSQCAAACFLQTNFLWPACRSFDVRLVRWGEMTRVVCKLNSITLRQALASERFDLIADASLDETDEQWDDEKDDETNQLGKQKGETTTDGSSSATTGTGSRQDSRLRAWHFEPVAGFAADELLLAGRLEQQSLGASVWQRDSRLTGAWGLLCLGALGLGLGLLAGNWLATMLVIVDESADAQQLVASAAAASSELVLDLNEQQERERPQLAFNNLVNFEGQIREE